MYYVYTYYTCEFAKRMTVRDEFEETPTRLHGVIGHIERGLLASLRTENEKKKKPFVEIFHSFICRNNKVLAPAFTGGCRYKIITGY